MVGNSEMMGIKMIGGGEGQSRDKLLEQHSTVNL